MTTDTPAPATFTIVCCTCKRTGLRLSAETPPQLLNGDGTPHVCAERR